VARETSGGRLSARAGTAGECADRLDHTGVRSTAGVHRRPCYRVSIL
jgi:hypothetical protein